MIAIASYTSAYPLNSVAWQKKITLFFVARAFSFFFCYQIFANCSRVGYIIALSSAAEKLALLRLAVSVSGWKPFRDHVAVGS